MTFFPPSESSECPGPAPSRPAGRADPRAWGFAVYPLETAAQGHAHLPALRQAVREERTIRLTYQKPSDIAAQTREVRPLQLEFWGWAWTLTAWCELRQDFRVFRMDRIQSVELLAARFKDEPGRGLADYLAIMAQSATSRRSR